MAFPPQPPAKPHPTSSLSPWCLSCHSLVGSPVVCPERLPNHLGALANALLKGLLLFSRGCTK